jgi:hypothetical protein
MSAHGRKGAHVATEEELAALRRLTVDLAKDGHLEQATAAATVHDLISETSPTPDTSGD